MLILLVGLTSSGKSTAADILSEMGFSVASTGDVIRDEIKNRGWQYNKENDVRVSRWFNEEAGEKEVIKRLRSNLQGDKKVIDGIRSHEMLEKLVEYFGENPVIIAIRADSESRYLRECERKKFTGFTREDMEKRDDAHLKMGTGEMMKMADYTIDNTSLTKEELRKELKSILDDINI